jgi:hypothetical protein
MNPIFHRMPTSYVWLKIGLPVTKRWPWCRYLSSLKFRRCFPQMISHQMFPNSLDFISSQFKHSVPRLTLSQGRIGILGSYVAVIILSSQKACDSRWLGPSNVRSVNTLGGSTALSSMSHRGKTRQHTFNIQLGRSAVVWSGGSRSDCQVLVPSSLEVLQIFEISWLGNQSTYKLAVVVDNWRADGS